MKFIDLQASLASQWDMVVNNSDDAWLFHTSDWLELSEKHWDITPKSFLLEYEGKIIGVFPLQLNRKSKSLRSSYMGLGGPALINGLQEGVRAKALKAMHERACLIAKEHASPFIEVSLDPLSNRVLNDRWQVNPLVHYFYEDLSTHTFMLDLIPSEEELFDHFSSSAKHQINACREKGYSLTALERPSQIKAIWEIHRENRLRTQAAVHPQEFFEDFYHLFCQKGLAAIWLGVDPQGVPVAFETTGFFKKGSLYWMGSCKNDHLDSGINYLLQHHAIRWAKQQGALWYNNGEAFPNMREGKLHGISEFKGRFGGELHRLFRGKIILEHQGRLERLLCLLTKRQKIITAKNMKRS